MGVSSLATSFLQGAMSPNTNAAFRQSAVGRFSGQQESSRSRSFRQTSADQTRLRTAQARLSHGGLGSGGSSSDAQKRIAEQIVSRAGQGPAFSFGARQSELQSQFFGEDIRRAGVNKGGLDSLLGRQKRQTSGGGGFLGRPSGASSFSTLLRSF